MNGKLVLLFTVPVIVASFARGADEPPKEHPEIASIKKLYLTDLEPIQKRYRSRLEAAQKELTRKGDLPGALAVKAELEQLGLPDKKAATPPTSLKGIWAVKYSNGNVRTYTIREDGTVYFAETNAIGKLSQKGDDLLVDFSDGKLERLVLKQVLSVEHFNPKTLYATGAKASETAIGDKSK